MEVLTLLTPQGGVTTHLASVPPSSEPPCGPLEPLGTPKNGQYGPIASTFFDLQAVLTEKPPKIPWAVDGLLAEQDLAMLSGTGGIGKSYVLIALAISLAAGKPLFKRFEVTRPYRVLYLDLEMAEYETHRRFHRMLRGAGEVPGGLLVAPSARLRLDKADHVEVLARLVKEWGIEFMLVDSYRRVYGGDDKESSSSNAVFNALAGLRSHFGLSSVFIAHWRKKKAEEELNEPGERLLGSVDQKNMIDCHIAIQRTGEDKLKIIPDKSRHANNGEDGSFEVTWLHEDPYDDDGPFQMVHVPSGLEQDALKVLDLVLKHKSITYKWTEEHVHFHPKKLQRIARLLESKKACQRVKKGREWFLEI